jgi:hypothetical protein
MLEMDRDEISQARFEQQSTGMTSIYEASLRATLQGALYKMTEAALRDPIPAEEPRRGGLLGLFGN